VTTVVFLLGVCLIIGGVSLITIPGALVVAGAALTIAAVLAERNGGAQ
jgi:glucose dehydrogenase